MRSCCRARAFALKVDPKAPLRDSSVYRTIGKSIPRPDVPAKVTGTHTYVHDLTIPGMLHARVIRPGSVGAQLISVDPASIRAIPGVRVVRVNDLVAVVGADEWDVVAATRKLKVQLVGKRAARRHRAACATGFARGRSRRTRRWCSIGDAKAALAAPGKKLSAEYFWPIQSHASMGPSCAVADVRDGKATIWSASQATHKFRETIAARARRCRATRCA